MSQSYAEAICELLKGRVVEIHTNTNKKTRNYFDYSMALKSIIRGTIIDARGDVLVVDCDTRTGGTTRVWLNDWLITGITEYEPGKNFQDIYLDEDEHTRNKEIRKKK